MNAPISIPLNIFYDLEKLSRKELIERVNYLQSAIFKQDQTLHDVSCKLGEMCTIANKLSSQLYALCDAFDENDQEAIAVQLNTLSERRKSFQKTKVH